MLMDKVLVEDNQQDKILQLDLRPPRLGDRPQEVAAWQRGNPALEA